MMMPVHMTVGEGSASSGPSITNVSNFLEIIICQNKAANATIPTTQLRSRDGFASRLYSDSNILLSINICSTKYCNTFEHMSN